LCALYDVDKETSEEFMNLARAAREQGWWTQYEDLQMDPYLGLEQAAKAITSYTMYYMPALLQTEEYTRAIIEAIAPKMNPEILEQRVEARMRRQLVLEDEDGPRYRVLLDEAVLHRSVGGPEITAAQLDKVLDAERRGKVIFQVIPFSVGAHAAQDSNFILFEFEENTNQSSVIFVEGLTGNQYIEKTRDIARYREAIDYLRDAALSPPSSVRLMAEIKNAHLG
jgi:hypothetical protein